MTVEASASLAEQPPREQEAPAPSPARFEHRLAAVLLSLLPGALVVYFSFNAGGFFPGSVGFATLLVIQMIVLRVLVADNPFAGYTRLFGATALAFTAYAGWILLSQAWSDSESRAMIEFDRALLYLSVLILFGLVPRRQWRMPWVLRGLAFAVLGVCTCGLITRLLPDVWPVSPNLAEDRLSFPLTYWNALGLLAGVGIVLALGTAANARERAVVKAIGAAFVPVAATTLFFTFSRGAIAATIVGVVVYLLVAHSWSLLGTLLATAPTTLIALLTAYDADLLASTNPTSRAAIDQGHDVASAVVLCALAAGVIRYLTARFVDRPLTERRREPWSRGRVLGAWSAAVAALAIALVVAGAPSWTSDQVDRFLHTTAPKQGNDFRNRLTDPSSNGRVDHWDAALKGFSKQPLHGQGAGTYEFTWDRYRKLQVTVVDAHGLYFEVMSEYGIVGLILLLTTIGLILVSLLRSARGPNRMVYAVLFAAVLTWAIHAGVDWDWEMPATTVWVFAIGGAALAGRRAKRAKEPMGDRGRIPIAAALLVVAVTPTLLMLSQHRLDNAGRAFDKGDCRTAKREAIASLNVLGNRPQAFQILGYCDLSNGRTEEAVAAMKKAVEEEPRSWEYHYSLAIAQGEAGLDPRPEMAKAVAATPTDGYVRSGANRLDGKTTPSEWTKEAQALDDDVRVSGRLTLR